MNLGSGCASLHLNLTERQPRLADSKSWLMYLGRWPCYVHDVQSEVQTGVTKLLTRAHTRPFQRWVMLPSSRPSGWKGWGSCMRPALAAP